MAHYFFLKHSIPSVVGILVSAVVALGFLVYLHCQFPGSIFTLYLPPGQILEPSNQAPPENGENGEIPPGNGGEEENGENGEVSPGNGEDEGNGEAPPENGENGETPPGNGAEEITWKTYKNEENKFEVQYFSNWVADETIEPALVVTILSPYENESDPYQDNVNIASKGWAIPVPPSLGLLVKLARPEVEKVIDDFKVLEEQDITFIGLPAKKQIVTGRVRGTDTKGFLIYFLNSSHNRVYLVGYSAEVSRYADYLDRANQIINTFKLI